MGFRPKIHHLTFEEFTDSENPENSLFVDVTAPSLAESLIMSAGRQEDEDGQHFMRRCFAYLAPRIRAWNLEDDNGHPIAASVEALMDTDEHVVHALVKRWRRIGEAEPTTSPLGSSSAPASTAGPTGEPSAASMEMEHSIPTS